MLGRHGDEVSRVGVRCPLTPLLRVVRVTRPLRAVHIGKDASIRLSCRSGFVVVGRQRRQRRSLVVVAHIMRECDAALARRPGGRAWRASWRGGARGAPRGGLLVRPRGGPWESGELVGAGVGS